MSALSQICPFAGEKPWISWHDEAWGYRVNFHPGILSYGSSVILRMPLYRIALINTQQQNSVKWKKLSPLHGPFSRVFHWAIKVLFHFIWRGSCMYYLGLAWLKIAHVMLTSSNGNIFRVTGHLCGEFTGPRWRSDAELWCFLWSASE